MTIRMATCAKKKNVRYGMRKHIYCVLTDDDNGTLCKKKTQESKRPLRKDETWCVDRKISDVCDTYCTCV
jgi:hypothetical protein